MEGAYNKVYRARDRVPRPEFGFLLEMLMSTIRSVVYPPRMCLHSSVRSQIAATIEASYMSLPQQTAATLLFYKSSEGSQLQQFASEVRCPHDDPVRYAYQ